MSRKHAVLQNNVVSEILLLEEEQVSAKAKEVEAIIDIEDTIPRPEVGWVLSGNTLIQPTQNLTSDQLDSYQQTAQRLFGLKLLPSAVDRVGARNLKLAREATPADVVSLANQMASIKLLLEGGALKTARTVCLMIKPSFPLHADILQAVADEITNFLQTNGWN